jgi:tetratricopeptide (TPR) repeat protein
MQNAAVANNDSTTPSDGTSEPMDAPIFMDTRSESPTQQPSLVTSGSTSQRESGLSLALSTMRKGERARFYIQDPKYGYGDRGSFSFPAVPPNSRLVYDVELIHWEAEENETGEGGEGEEDDSGVRGLLFEERLERAERHRVQGNALYAQEKFKEALGRYAVSLSYLDDDLLMQLEGDYLDKAHSLKIPVHLNMAACQLQTGDQNTAIYNCTEVLNIEPGNVKALFRRAKARRILGQVRKI